MRKETASILANRKNKRTWVVVADSGRGRILESESPHSGVTIHFNSLSDGRLTGGQLAPDRLPRAHSSAGPMRHGIDPRQTLKKHEEDIFIARLVNYLTGSRGKFDQLVLVAPVRTANALLTALPPSVNSKVVMTRKKDMTWMRTSEVLDRLGPMGKGIQRSRKK